jgi:hypothetical protein
LFDLFVSSTRPRAEHRVTARSRNARPRPLVPGPSARQDKAGAKPALSCLAEFGWRNLAGGQGFEPWLTESESVVLPLDDPPMKRGRGPNLLLTDLMLFTASLVTVAISSRAFDAIEGAERGSWSMRIACKHTSNHRGLRQPGNLVSIDPVFAARPALIPTQMTLADSRLWPLVPVTRH